MTIAQGTLLGPYEIVAPLGAGGMGEVYRARDARLNREVAIKILPASFANDEDRLRRFKQEALASSALNHPNILTVYDIGSASLELGGSPYIVAELLEGEELREQLHEGALPLRQALDYAQQITQGLSAAHEKGITHRDLKPENLFVTHAGRIKILDFGLAKLKPQKPVGSADSQSPTRMPQTDPGTVMGTVGYMSPEQVRGQDADHRSDLFSFGAILYEMLTCKRAFQGESMAETMTAIVKDEPPEITEINSKVPPQLERIVRRCLEKKPERRFQSTSDLSFALEALSAPSGSRLDSAGPLPVMAESAGDGRLFGNARLAWIVAAVLLIIGLAALPFAIAYFRRSSPDTRVIKLTLQPPEKASFGQIAVSPDGSHVAFTAATGGNELLWVRALETTSARPLAGTEGARYPFWSPDNRWLAFFASGKLKRIEATGGPAQTLCEAWQSWGGAWNRDGVIIFEVVAAGLSRLSATGGEVTPVTTLDEAHQELNHQSPSFLPDGRHFLYYIRSAQKEIRGIYLGSLDGGIKQRLLGADSAATYAQPGYLLFASDGALMAQRFDAQQLRLTGEMFPVAERIGSDPDSSRGNFSVSDGGVLVYDPIAVRQIKQLIWVDRGGKPIGPSGLAGAYTRPWLSPDEQQVAVDQRDSQTGTLDLWLLNAGGTASRFTFDPGNDQYPLWSPDGSRIVWTSNRGGTFDLYQRAASGAGQDELLLKTGYRIIPTDWSPDGRFIVFYQVDPKTRRDVWVLPLAGDRRPIPFLHRGQRNRGSALS